MSEVNWVDALGSLDWTLIIISLLGGSGLLGIYIQSRGVKRRKEYGREVEDEASNHEMITHYDFDAIHLASKAMSQVESISERLNKAESDLKDVSKDYRSLYRRVDRLISRWSVVRNQEEAPDLLEGIRQP